MFALLRKLMPIIALMTLAAAIYDGWIFYSRYRARREGIRAEQEDEAARARKTVDLLGGGGLRILNFYATRGAIRRGEHANLCYGVNGAKSVRIEPLTEELHPAVSYCLQVSPASSTSYTLIAEDAQGHTAKQSFVIQVNP